MLNIPQIEALKRINTHLYESLKRVVSGVNNLKLSLDSGITDGADFARVSADALTQNKVDPAKSGVLMRGSVAPTWSGAFTYASTISSITWSWNNLAILRADGTQTQIADGSLAISGLSPATTYFSIPIGTKRSSPSHSSPEAQAWGQGIHPTHSLQKPFPLHNSKRSKDVFRSPPVLCQRPLCRREPAAARAGAPAHASAVTCSF